MRKFHDGRDWFFEKRFGLFVHWGLYALTGWHEQMEWRGRMPRCEYDKLITDFNPTHFDPEQWLDDMQAAGMEYLCFTTKHHDGFCMFDTKYTDFNVMNSPFGKDIVGMVADACHKRGIPFGLYYSVPDWHHPNYGYAAGKGIPVCNVPAYGTDSVAQFAIALLLEICHHVAHHSQTVHEGKWTASADFCYWDYPLIELRGKTMGIIGFGRIGRQTARIAAALGMKLLAYDTFTDDEGRQLADYVTLDELFAASDVIALHCPLFPETSGIINAANIAKMKDGVIIINNSRGPLIVEQDLADALNSGKVAAAGLDVVSTEPIRADNPLLQAKNCFITPHISWAPPEARQRIMDCTVQNVRAYVEGKPIHVVNG